MLSGRYICVCLLACPTIHPAFLLRFELKNMAARLNKMAPFLFLLAFASLPLLAIAECECERGNEEDHDKQGALKLKIIAIICILAASAIGCAIPSLGRKFPALSPDNDLFFVVKAFAGGVILATAFVHILPEAFKKLDSPCLDGAWKEFPFTGLIVMLAAIATLIVDTIATGYFKRAQANKTAVGDAEMSSGHHAHSGHGHGHAHGISSVIVAASSSTANADDSGQLIRHRIISQVSIELLFIACIK
jgi:solute carrier family 39 (zinc transporter), member 1/2/3